MKNLRNFNVHKWHNEPNLEDVYYPYIVFEQCTNFPFIHFITASSEDEALSTVYEAEADSYTEVDEDGPILSAEMVLVDEDDIEWYKRLNHLN